MYVLETPAIGETFAIDLEKGLKQKHGNEECISEPCLKVDTKFHVEREVGQQRWQRFSLSATDSFEIAPNILQNSTAEKIIKTKSRPTVISTEVNLSHLEISLAESGTCQLSGSRDSNMLIADGAKEPLPVVAFNCQTVSETLGTPGFIRYQHDEYSSGAKDSTTLANTGNTYIPRISRIIDLAKFIPVKLPVPREVPRILHNQRDESEWKRAQEALEMDKTHSLIITNKLITDFHNISSEKDSGHETISHKIDSSDDTAVIPIEGHYRTRSNHPPSITSVRFDRWANEEYCRVSSQFRSDFTAVVYFECPNNYNKAVQLVKTEMVMLAIMHFFYPCRFSNAVWTANIQQQLSLILNNFTEPVVEARFYRVDDKNRSADKCSCYTMGEKDAGVAVNIMNETKSRYSSEYRNVTSILLLSSDAGRLLRHQHSGLLLHLAAALESTQNQIMVLVKAPKLPNNRPSQN